MPNKNDGKFRKKVPFAAVSLIALQDDNLSLKAKGLYGLIQSYITLPGTLYKNTLIKKSTDGLRAFNSSWDELKEHGYLKQYRIREEKGWRYEYDLLDEPDLDTPATIDVGLNGEIIEKPIKEQNSSENTKDETKHSNTNSDKSEAPHNNHPASINSSNHQIRNQNNDERIHSEENDDKQMLSERNSYHKLILENIDYEVLSEDDSIDREQLDELVELMVDAVCTRKKVLRIAGDDLPAETVKSRFLKLESSHIEYVLSCLKKNTTKIRNIKQYLLTTLYNSSFTIENYYSSKVNHDLYGQD